MKHRYFGDRAFYKTALAVALPIMVQNGITNFVSLLDNIMVGRVGTEAMSGVSIANILLFVFNLTIFGMVSGAGIYGAQFSGKGDTDGVRDTFRFRIAAGTILGIAGCGIFLGFGEFLISRYLQGEGTPEQIAASLSFGTEYLRIMLLGIPGVILVQCYSSVLRETGRTVLPMAAGIAAVLVNLLFNWLLIFGNLGFPAMGSAGAAVATVLSRYVEAAVILIGTYADPKKSVCFRGAFRQFRLAPGLTKKITLKALPLMLNETLWSLGMALLNQAYSIRGYDVVAATNIAITVTNVCNVAFLAMGSAIGIIVGQQLGAGELEQAVDTDRKLIVFSEMTCLLFGGVLAAISRVFPGFYNTSEEVRSLASSFILISALLMPLHSYSNAAYFTIRSGGKTFITFLFDSVYACGVVATVSFLLSRFTDLPIRWLYFCCQGLELGKCIVGFFLIRSGIWIQNIVKEEEPNDHGAIS